MAGRDFKSAGAANPAADPSCRTLYIADLPSYFDDAFLRQLFQGTGTLVSAKVVRNKTTLASEGYGFLDFVSHQAAAQALAQLNGTVIHGTDRRFRLNWAGLGSSRGSEGDGTDFSVFVGDLGPEVTDYVLQENFRRFFPSVRSAKVITDALSNRSKGYGFVRFGDEKDRDRSLGEMQGHYIANRPIRVSLATAKRASTGSSQPSTASRDALLGELDQNNTTLFIGALSSSVTEEDLRSFFGRFGDIVYTKIPAGKGCGFVQYVNRASAELAMQQMQGQIIGTSAIRISWGKNSMSRMQGGAPYPGFSGHPSAAAPTALPGDLGFPYYQSLPGAAAPSVDPYAAYAYALQQQASSASSPLLQALQEQHMKDLQLQMLQDAGRNNHPSLAGPLAPLATQNPGVPANPGDPLNIDLLNAKYLQRHQDSLLGPLNRHFGRRN